MNNITQIDKSIPSIRDQRRALRAFALATTAGIVSYQTFMSNFLSLYAHQFGFSSVMIGTLFFVVQLTAVCQIWMARYTDRKGGRGVLLLFSAVAPLALLPLILSPEIRTFLGPSVATGAVFASSISYALLIGLAAVAWLPLLRHNLPVDNRTQHVGRINQVAMLFAFLVTMSFSFFLGSKPALFRFQMIFGVAAILMVLRVLFLRPIRDFHPHAPVGRTSILSQLRRLWETVPFRRLCILVFLFFGGSGMTVPFRALYVKALGFPDGFAAFVTSSMGLLAFAVAIRFFGRMADRHGSRALFVTGGIGFIVCLLMALLATGSTFLDRIIVIVGLAGMSTFWAALDAGYVHRLFAVVPKEGQSLYMVVYMFVINIAVSGGAFIGGFLTQGARWFVPEVLASSRFGAGVEYRFVFVVSGVVMVLGVLHALRMRVMKESSVPHLLLYIRLSAQRWLMNRRAGLLFRFRGAEPEER